VYPLDRLSQERRHAKHFRDRRLVQLLGIELHTRLAKFASCRLFTARCIAPRGTPDVDFLHAISQHVRFAKGSTRRLIMSSNISYPLPDRSAQNIGLHGLFRTHPRLSMIATLPPIRLGPRPLDAPSSANDHDLLGRNLQAEK
jgi:hypothetical protein